MKQVLLDGRLIGQFDRDGGVVLNVSAAENNWGGDFGANRTLDIVVMAMGRSNFGCDWDFKGLQSGDVTLNGALLARPRQ